MARRFCHGAQRDRPSGHVEEREHADDAAAARLGGRTRVGAQPVRAVRQHDAFRTTGAALVKKMTCGVVLGGARDVEGPVDSFAA